MEALWLLQYCLHFGRLVRRLWWSAMGQEIGSEYVFLFFFVFNKCGFSSLKEHSVSRVSEDGSKWPPSWLSANPWILLPMSAAEGSAWPNSHVSFTTFLPSGTSRGGRGECHTIFEDILRTFISCP